MHMNLRSIFLYLLLLMSFPAFSQQQDFTLVDSFARTIAYHKDIFRLTNELTAPYSTQMEKTRAIFIWITENIRYDSKLAKQDDPKIPANQYDYLKKILTKKKAICDGYARLFTEMCKIAGVRCDKISGNVKQEPYQIGSAAGPSHAWNAVWIDSTYYLMDATWAAGFSEKDENTGKVGPFQKRFDDYYWCTPPEDFYHDHYPRDTNWVVAANVPKEKYINTPYIETGHMKKLHIIAPETGYIHPCKGDTIRFDIRYTKRFEKLQINTNVRRNIPLGYWKKKQWIENPNALPKQSYVPFTRIGDNYLFEYVVADNGLAYIDILFDYKRLVRFKVRIRED